MSVDDTETGAVVVSWSAPSPVQGAPNITNYVATAFTETSGTSNAGTCETGSPSTLSCSITGLTPGSTYYFGVRALAGATQGTPSSRVAHTLSSSGGPTSGFVQISAGATHACAVTTGGEAWCWGDNASGQLGIGADFETDFPFPVQVAMPDGVLVADISAGYQHTCARTTTGDLYCWGDDSAQQLGDGDDDTSIAWGPTPVADPTAGSVQWVQVSAGFEHTCGRTSGGVLYCWGSNDSGQLGIGTAMSYLYTPMPVDVASTIPDTYIWVSAGSNHSCATATDGSGWCWGGNIGGQLGSGSDTGTSQLSPVAVVMTGIPGFTRIAAGAEFTCALESGSSGQAWCWGLELEGELGNGGASGESHLSPVAVAMPNGGVAFTQIDTDVYSACSLSTVGGAYCWGDDTLGAIGVAGNDADEDLSVEAPVAVDTAGSLPDAYVAIDAGADFTCAITSAGEAWCWGDNNFGQLGTGDWDDEYLTSPSRVVPPGTNLLDRISIGDGVACALDLIGRAWCWGSNTDGQIGDGTRSDRLTPTATTMPVVDGVPIVFEDISVGDRHVCAIDQFDAAWCWGENGLGQVGDGTTEDRLVPVAVSMPSSEGAQIPFTHIEVGTDFSCSVAFVQLYSESSVWCWGSGSNGEIGDGDVDVELLPTKVNLPYAYSYGGLTTGAAHACIGLVGAGRMWCWGDNAYGQLGDGTTDDGLEPVEVVRPTVGGEPLWMTGVAAAAGGYHTCAGSQDNVSVEWWCWGRGTSGQLGHGLTSNSSSPVQVQTPLAAAPGFTSIDLGLDFTCGVSSAPDYAVWCWGEGGDGQMGNGLAADASTPTRVTQPVGVEWSGLRAGPVNMCAELRDSSGNGAINGLWCWGRASLWVYSSAAIRAVPTPLVPGTAPTAITSFGQLGLSFVGLLALGALTRSASSRRTRRTRRRRTPRAANGDASERGDG